MSDSGINPDWFKKQVKKPKGGFFQSLWNSSTRPNDDFEKRTKQGIREHGAQKYFDATLKNSSDEIKRFFVMTIGLVRVIETYGEINDISLDFTKATFIQAGSSEADFDSLIFELTKVEAISFKSGNIIKGPNYDLYIAGIMSVAG